MLENILFASDFTNITDKAEEYARTIAKATGAKVTILHSVEPIEGASENDEVQRFLTGLEDNARAKGAAVVDRFRADGIDCELVVNTGKRWKMIVDLASERSFDLVVLGAHKVTDGDKVYLGTTTHKVFFASNAPLLVVPSS